MFPVELGLIPGSSGLTPAHRLLPVCLPSQIYQIIDSNFGTIPPTIYRNCRFESSIVHVSIQRGLIPDSWDLHHHHHHLLLADLRGQIYQIVDSNLPQYLPQSTKIIDLKIYNTTCFHATRSHSRLSLCHHRLLWVGL
jgi:hypothetical protein